MRLSTRPDKDIHEVRRFLDGRVEVIWRDGVRRVYSKIGYTIRVILNHAPT